MSGSDIRQQFRVGLSFISLRTRRCRPDRLTLTAPKGIADDRLNAQPKVVSQWWRQVSYSTLWLARHPRSHAVPPTTCVSQRVMRLVFSDIVDVSDRAVFYAKRRSVFSARQRFSGLPDTAAQGGFGCCTGATGWFCTISKGLPLVSTQNRATATLESANAWMASKISFNGRWATPTEEKLLGLSGSKMRQRGLSNGG